MADEFAADKEKNESLKVFEILRLGFKRCVARNGLILIAINIVLSPLINLSTIMLAASLPNSTGKPIVQESLVVPEAFFPITLVFLCIFLSLVSVIYAIGCLRLFVTNETEDVPIRHFTKNIIFTLFHFIAASFCFALIVFLGTILFIIPGIYLAIAFWFFNVFIAVEGCKFLNSLHRSWQFTSGNRWFLFRVGVMVFLLVMLAAGIISGLDLLFAEFFQGILGETIKSIIYSPFSVFVSAITATTYVKISGIRRRKNCRRSVSDESGSMTGNGKKDGSWLSCAGMGCGGIFLICILLFATGYYYIYYGSQFHYREKELSAERTVQLSYEKELTPGRGGIIAGESNHSVRLSGLEVGTGESKLTINLEVATDPLFDSDGEFLRKVFTFKRADLLKKNNDSDQISPQKLSADIPESSLRKIKVELEAGVSDSTDISKLEGFRGTVEYEKPIVIEEYSFQTEDGKYMLRVDKNILKIEIDGENIFFPDLDHVGQAVYFKAFDSSGELINSRGTTNMPKTFVEERSYVQKIQQFFHNKNQLNIKYVTEPSEVKFYLTRRFQKLELDFDLQFQPQVKEILTPREETEVTFDGQVVTMKPIEEVDDRFSVISSTDTDSDSVIYKWEGFMKEIPTGVLAARFYNEAGEPIENRGKGHQVSRGGNVEFPYKFHYRLEQIPAKTEIIYLMSEELN